MSTIYELTDEYMTLLDMAEDPDIDAEALAGSMESIMGEIEEKAVGYGKVIRQLEADRDSVKAEADRLTKKAKTIDNNIKNVKSIFQHSMELLNISKIKTELFSFNIQNNPASCVIEDYVEIEDIPEEYIKVEKSINKAAIKEALKNGQEFDFAHLEQTKSLRIR